jgi:predicted HD superfamily hydrolase involved in NAD metabolism
MIIYRNKDYIVKNKIRKRIMKYLQHHSTPYRLQHSIQVAKLAKKMCVHYNIDPYKGLTAGLGHDIARELHPHLIMNYAGKDAEPISEIEMRNPILLHGRAGAVILHDEICMKNEQILAAVRYHVLGSPDMTLLSKIIFAADFLEPTRYFLDDKHRKNILKLPIDAMLLQVLDILFTFFKKNNCPIAEQSIVMYNRLKELEQSV